MIRNQKYKYYLLPTLYHKDRHLEDSQLALILATLCFAFVSLIPAHFTYASPTSGFALMEQSGRGLGQAFAGASAGLGDGSSVYYNPAAMLALDSDIASFAGSLVLPQAEFNNRGSRLNPTLGSIATSGVNAGDAAESGLVPSIYLVNSLSPDLRFGLGVNSPYGLSTDYSDDWVGRYHALESKLVTINSSAAIGYRVSPHLSLGAGFSLMYLDADLSNAIDFGSVAVSRLGLERASALGLLPQMADGKVDSEGDDVAAGYNLGLMLEIPETETRLGLAFHSRIDTDLSGDAKFEVPASASILTSSGSFIDTDVNAGVSLPESLSLGFRQPLGEYISLSGEASWTRWSRFEELRVSFGSSQADSVTEENWKNTWRFALGINFEPSKNLIFRSGYSFQESPIKSREFRTPRIPVADRHWITTGFSYRINENLNFDLNYAHLFVVDAYSVVPSSTGDILDGKWDLEVDIVSMGFAWSWG